MRTRSELDDLRKRFMSFRLERALSRLKTPLYFLNTGAHPDDENSALLAWLRFGRGLSVGTLSSTRGQGGQNRIGPERGALLGLIRSREMEHAAQVLDADHIWLDQGPGDPLTDFGFSKSGVDTLQRWGGAASVVDRMVRVYRRYRPDIILPTFLDVPGQHGHHRAMTKAALDALPLAADPAYRTDDLAPWQVAKAYLPAWSGGGATYDDELPPPPATLTVAAGAIEPWTGTSWGQIGESARLCHATQDMGDPDRDGDERWPLHLMGGEAEADILDNLPKSYAQLSDAPNGLGQLDLILGDLVGLRGQELVAALVSADRQLESAVRTASPSFHAAHGHRLSRLKAALDRAILLADDALPPSLVADAPIFRSGDSVRVECDPPLLSGATLRLSCPPGFACHMAKGRRVISATAEARPLASFHTDWKSLGGNGNIHVEVEKEIEGRRYRAKIDFKHEPVFLPDGLLDWRGGPLIHRRGEGATDWLLDLPEGAEITLPQGMLRDWQRLRVDEALPEGTYNLPVTREGQQLLSAHVGHLASGEAVYLFEPFALSILSLDLKLPEGRIGYLPGTEDISGLLQAMGLNVTVLEALPEAGELAQIDTLLLGVVAFGCHPSLTERLSNLQRWVRQGGNLVTFYQRPDQGWPADGIGLDLLQVGVPSLRWRVTDPAAPVSVLAADCALLNKPNRISERDWQGWDKERGLYFAAQWGAQYQPLLAMADPGEVPLQGGLISGQFGRGRHTHVSLTLHHQLEHGRPGAFRLLANLLDTPSRSPEVA